ncbi:MAG: hypothetical protein WCF61_07535 [Terriglobales bacterium]
MNPPTCAHYAGRLLTALAAIASMLLAAGCGNNNNIGFVAPLGGNFSKSSLSGTYVMRQTGYYANSITGAAVPFSETTIFSANGNGSLTILEDDGGPQNGGPENLAGSYAILRDGEGSLTFNYTSFPTTYNITMIDTNHFYVMEADTFATSAGYGILQSSTAIPSGTFVFKSHNFGISSRVGGIAIAGGVFTGTQDILTPVGGTNASQSITGALGAPSSTGVGTFSLTAATGSFSGNYYVVSPTEFYFLANPNSGSLEIGQAELQTGGPFSATNSLTAGSYVLGSRGDTIDTSLIQPAIHTAGVFTTDGAGNVTTGTVDYVNGSNVEDNNGAGLTVSAGANYTFDPSGDGNGIVTLPLSNGATLSEIFWMTSPTSAYFLNNSAQAVEDGSFSAQTGAVSTLNSQAAFVMDGFPGTYGDQVGVFEPTAGSNFNWNEEANQAGYGALPVGTNGAYTAATNGRFTVTVNNFNNLTGNASFLVFYLSSPTTGYMVEVDGSGDIGGVFTQQTSP